ncbi:MAG: F420-0:Gamma-glutamyl ligase, partial [Synechococcales bacterium]|nr:F420-0:Gamma-glutamyl ligase [Synechococcales bacterium]
MILWYSLLAVLAILAVAAIGLDLQYRNRAGNRLELTAGKWALETKGPQHYSLTGSLEMVNQT